mmetsp:Transcript_105341/g.186104  ORF Transcript_105341/g.186104 Transcript_105341/m.186104 type:complete len:122 (+) Transcript_105341:3-368(+)
MMMGVDMLDVYSIRSQMMRAPSLDEGSAETARASPYQLPVPLERLVFETVSATPFSFMITSSSTMKAACSFRFKADRSICKTSCCRGTGFFAEIAPVAKGVSTAAPSGDGFMYACRTKTIA